MILARRLVVALAALVGVVVAVLGLCLAVVLGPSGSASFTARATGPVLVGSDVLGALDVPVTVRAHRDDAAADAPSTSPSTSSSAGGVFVAEARSVEVADVVGASRVLRATGTRFPARVLDLEPVGSGTLADPRTLDVWRATGRGSLEVAQAGASAVLVVPSGDEPVTVVVTRQHPTWFLEALVAVVAGLIVAGAAGWWLVHQLGHLIPFGSPRGGRGRPRPAGPVAADPSHASTPEARS